MKFPRFNIKKKPPVGAQASSPATADTAAAPADGVASAAASQQPPADEAASQQPPAPAEAPLPVLSEKISINAIFGCIWRNKWKYILPLLLTGALVAWLALCIPRYYKVTVMLAPEYNLPTSSLGSLASSIGLDFGSMTSTDAIVPLFYPDLIGSTDSLVPLFNVKVTTKDGKFKGRYADYLMKQTKRPWWETEMAALMAKIAPPPQSSVGGEQDTINPFALTYAEDQLMRGIKGSINCTVDKKTDVITLTTQAQDPLVAALLADTVRVRLQNFIIQYRTVKARRDLDLVEKQCEDAHNDYLKKQAAYATFVDANQDLVLETFKAKEKDLEDEMQLAFNAYSTLLTRVQLAKAKVQERTPAFTTLQNSSVPVKHAGPPRVMMVLGALVAAFIITTVVLISRDKRLKW